MGWMEAIGAAIQYVEDYITDELTVDMIADHVNISSFYFQKGFAMLCGFTISEYIRNRRLALAGNFKEQLANPLSEQAEEIIKDPYIFDFIPNAKKLREIELEDALVQQITKLLLEFGSGFAFMGRQYPIQVGKREFFIDLLFYNVKLHCYFVVELKTVEFEPEFAGKLSFYLSAVDGELKSPNDNPTIGLLLCKGKDKMVAEYALKDVNKPMGVSEYKLSNHVSEELQGKLPSIEDIEKRIN